jgi:hypothetical protein
MDNLRKLLKLHVKWFTEKEILRGEKIPYDLIENIIPTIIYVDYMRDSLGFSITISSAYRSLDHQKMVYNDINKKRRREGLPEIPVPLHSLHIAFNALDLRPTDWDISKLREMHQFTKQPFAFRFNKLNFYSTDILSTELRDIDMGFGYYSNFLHVDSRGVLGRAAPKSWGVILI